MGSRRTVHVTAERVTVPGLGKISLEAPDADGLSYYERIDARYAEQLGYAALEAGAEDINVTNEQEQTWND